MSRPLREVKAGTFSMTSRATIRDEARMLPTPEIIEAFLYIVAIAAQNFGILITAYAITPAERVLVYTDAEEKLPWFEEFVNKHMAAFLNSIQGRKGSVYTDGSYDQKVAADPRAALSLVATALARPVELGLFSALAEYADLSSSLAALGTTRILKRPPHKYFRNLTRWLETVEFTLHLPESAKCSLEEFQTGTTELLTERVARLNAERSAKGGAPVGRAAVDQLLPMEHVPAPVEAPPVHIGFEASSQESLQAAIKVSEDFNDEFSGAWGLWIKGKRDVWFPYGTWGMKVTQRANVLSAPTRRPPAPQPPPAPEEPAVPG